MLLKLEIALYKNIIQLQFYIRPYSHKNVFMSPYIEINNFIWSVISNKSYIK